MHTVWEASLRHRNFTLVEMLVVVAIIVILASLLMPAMQDAIDHARDLSCLNNSRQVIVGTLSYSDNYGGYLPYNLSTGMQLTNSAGYTGLGRLYGEGYVTDHFMLWCGNENSPANRRQQGSLNKSTGYKGLVKEPPYSDVQTDLLFRCGRRVNSGIVYHNYPTARVAKLAYPDDGLTMCYGSGYVNRLTWHDLHGGRGCSLGFVDGRAVYFDYFRFYSPAFSTDSYDNRYRADMPNVTLKRMTCLYYERPDKIKGWTYP